MKRLFAILLAVLLMGLLTLPAFAAGQVTLTATAADCAPGATITVAFGVEADSHIAAADFRVSYDTDTFQYVSYENGALVEGCMSVGNNHEGMVKYSLITTEELVDAGTLFTVTFTVDSKASGAHDFQFYAVDCSDYDMNALAANVAKATVNVSGAAVSDVTVEPVTSVDENGSQVVIKSEINSTVSKVEQTPVTEGEGQQDVTLPVWGKVLLIAVAVLAVAAIVVIVVILLFALRGKKPKKQPVEYTAILDETAADLLSVAEKTEEIENK